MFSAAMRTALQCGRWELALAQWEEMDMLMLDPEPAAHNIALKAFCRQGDWPGAERVLEGMRATGTTIAPGTYAFILSMSNADREPPAQPLGVAEAGSSTRGGDESYGEGCERLRHLVALSLVGDLPAECWD